MQYRLVFQGRDWKFDVPVPDGDDATILDAARRNLPDHLGVGTNAEPRLIDRVGSSGTIGMMGHEVAFVLTPV